MEKDKKFLRVERRGYLELGDTCRRILEFLRERGEDCSKLAGRMEDKMLKKLTLTGLVKTKEQAIEALSFPFEQEGIYQALNDMGWNITTFEEPVTGMVVGVVWSKYFPPEWANDNG